MDMRFIGIMTHNPTNRLPTEAEMASMHKLIVEGMKAATTMITSRGRR
jgi:hypothetical protein